MKTIVVKINEEILRDTELICKAINTSHNKYIQDALKVYNHVQKRKLLEKRLKKDSNLSRKESMNVLKEFEDLDSTCKE